MDLALGEQRVEEPPGVVDGHDAGAARPARSRCRPRPRPGGPRRGRSGRAPRSRPRPRARRRSRPGPARPTTWSTPGSRRTTEAPAAPCRARCRWDWPRAGRRPAGGPARPPARRPGRRRTPPDWSDLDPKVPTPSRHPVGVAVDDLHVPRSGCRAGPPRAWPTRSRGPGRAARCRCRTRAVPSARTSTEPNSLPRDAVRDLDVGRQPDARAGARAPDSRRRAAPPAARVAGRGQHPVERPLVVAEVVGGAGGGGEREPVLPDQVLAAHLGRVHADLGGEHVHHPLDRRRRLGAAGAPVGDGRRGVGGHRRRWRTTTFSMS